MGNVTPEKQNILSQLKSLKEKMDIKKARLQELHGQKKQLIIQLEGAYDLKFEEVHKYVDELEDNRQELLEKIDIIEDELVKMLEKQI